MKSTDCTCKTSHSCSPSKKEFVSGACTSVNSCTNSYKMSVFDWLSGLPQAAAKEAFDVVEVRFKNERKAFYHNTKKLPVFAGSIIAVESQPGYDVGVVSLTGELVKIQMKKKKANQNQCLSIYRLASDQDIERWRHLQKREESVKIEARKIAQKLGLEMKITDVEFQGDSSRITFYYTAQGRVDFRQLIKEYIMAFRTKVDMKQIGHRQEAAKVGGMGSCGRELCCSTWLTDFRSVNTQSARYQQLSINPQKLAGQCGKLKCCLNYELDAYMEALSDFPKSSTSLETQKGKAFCVKIDAFRKKMWFSYAGNSIAWYDFSVHQVKNFIEENERGVLISPLEDYSTNAEKSGFSDITEENRIDRFEKKSKGKTGFSSGGQSRKGGSLKVKKEHTKDLSKPKKS